jgi:hypothetical protein
MDRHRQTDRQMGRTKAPLHLEPMEPVHFRVGNYVAIEIGHSVSLAPTVRKEYSYISTPFLGNYGLFYFEHYLLPARRVRRSLLQYAMQSDRCGVKCCVDCRYSRQDDTWVVADSVGYRSSCSALLGDCTFY